MSLTQRDLAVLRLARGDRQTTKVLVNEALRSFRRSKPEDAWEIADAKGVLCACRVAEGRYATAEPCLLESYQAIQQVRGEHSIYTRDALARLIKLYDAWDKPKQAAAYRQLATVELN